MKAVHLGIVISFSLLLCSLWYCHLQTSSGPPGLVTPGEAETNQKE